MGIDLERKGMRYEAQWWFGELASDPYEDYLTGLEKGLKKVIICFSLPMIF